MPTERQLSLEVERLRIEEVWRGSQSEFVSLSVAAAMTFHRVHGSVKAIVTPDDYDDALNIAATALSRILPVYGLKDPRIGRERIAVDVTRQRFMRGATRLRASDGSERADLSVRREELYGAVEAIKRAGIVFALTLSPENAAAQAVASRAEAKKDG